MNKRIAFLKKMVEDGKADSFARYALALEFKKEEQFTEALSAFKELRTKDPHYLPQYLMAGQMLLDEEQREEARSWLQAGLKVARSQGEGKAESEIEAALSDC